MLNQKRLITNTVAYAALLLSGCSSDAPPEPRVYPEADSATAQLYRARCGGCHVAPVPSDHIARVWPSVVQRMQMRMRAKGVPPLEQNELSEIMDYLQRHAGDRDKSS